MVRLVKITLSSGKPVLITRDRMDLNAYLEFNSKHVNCTYVVENSQPHMKLRKFISHPSSIWGYLFSNDAFYLHSDEYGFYYGMILADMRLLNEGWDSFIENQSNNYSLNSLT